MGDDEEEIIKGPVCSYLTYKSEGDRLYMLGEYEKAINSYTHALQQEPKNRNCLVARSRCYLAIGNTTLALKDAEASQLGNKEFYKGLYRKAETLYAKGEFELALMFYHRGHKLRPDDHNFRLGIQKAREAIDNSVGSPSSVKLDTKGDLSLFYRREEKVLPKTKSQLRRLKLNLKQQSMKTEQDEPKTSKTVRVLLGELYGDKEYLEKLLLDKELIKTATDSGGSIQGLIMSGITFLDTRTEFWRQQKPIFAREREQRIKAQSWKSHRKQAESEQTTFILERMEEIDMLLADGYAEQCKSKAMELVQIVKGWSQREVPNKAEFLGNLYSTIGLAQVELGEFEDALASHQKDLLLARKHDNLEAKSRALDNIGRVYARIGEFAKAVEAWSEKEPLTKTHLERTWLFHEIGRCHLELGNNVEARDYGLKALASAQKTGDEEWKMNANVLVAQAELKENKLQTAVTFFEQALSKAKVLNDEPAQEAISNALKDSKNQIALAEKVKQEEAEELQEKQKTRRLRLGPVVVDRSKPGKHRHAAFATDEVTTQHVEDLTESALRLKGIEQVGEAIEGDESCSEADYSSSDSVCGLYSSESLSPRESQVSTDQKVRQSPGASRRARKRAKQDSRESPDQKVPSAKLRDGKEAEQVAGEVSKPEKPEDISETDDSQCSSSTDSVCGFPSSHVSDSSLHDANQVDEQLPEDTENEKVTSEDANQSDEQLPESTENEGVAAEDANQGDEQLPENTENEGVTAEDANEGDEQLPENTENEGVTAEDANQGDEELPENTETEGVTAEDANEGDEELPENTENEGVAAEDANQGDEQLPENTENEGVTAEDANQVEEELPENIENEGAVSEEAKTQGEDTEAAVEEAVTEKRRQMKRKRKQERQQR
ncbi:tetratricopeptide repeat protein 25 isoform X4 [Scyliorhinus canicula]|uniref:tetratricopeptide repeat protein 25 isoform X4 n=1 Tax=Scyliorhinus canicula TaxID=7830 RepID=UPI0018F38387|nr:tetratricopeptide repeat protein 25 isoform X4 [Scyliorhinus canicula]